MADDLRKLTADLRGAATDVRARASQVVQKTAFDMVNEAQQNIFEADRIDTGAMLNSVGVDFSGSNASTTRAVVGPTVDYAPPHEYGTSRGIEGIHFMGRAADTVEPAFETAMGQLGIDQIGG